MKRNKNKVVKKPFLTRNTMIVLTCLMLIMATLFFVGAYKGMMSKENLRYANYKSFCYEKGYVDVILDINDFVNTTKEVADYCYNNEKSYEAIDSKEFEDWYKAKAIRGENY